MRKERPSEYVKVVVSLLPKAVLFGDSTVADLNDEQIDTLLATLRKQVLEHAAELNRWTRGRGGHFQAGS